MSVQASSSAKSWHEASNVWMWRTQARILVLAQKAPSWLVFPPSTFFHFFLKRDWGMAVGPFFAFAIYGDARSYDLFLSASSGGVICGTFKHIIRSPRPFWIVPDVFLKNGVEEMSWGTPSAHSAIQGAISAVLIYHDVSNSWNWIINIIVLLFVMYSRLFLAVHWPQDVVLGAIIGIVCGLIVCSSNIHHSMIEFSTTYSPAGGLVFLCVGLLYLIIIYIIVKLLDRISDSNPVPEDAIMHYKLGVARATHVLKEKSEEEEMDDNEQKKEKMYQQGSSVTSGPNQSRISMIFGFGGGGSPQKPSAPPSGVFQSLPQQDEDDDGNDGLDDTETGNKGTIALDSLDEEGGDNYDDGGSGSAPSTTATTNLSGALGGGGSSTRSLGKRTAFGADGRKVASIRRPKNRTSVAIVVDFEDEQRHVNVVDDLQQRGMGGKVLKAVEERSSVAYYQDQKTLEKKQKEALRRKKEMGIFLRTDVAFNPDTKERFWYNAVNAFGAYAGLAFYACYVSAEDVEFIPEVKWLAAVYATGISFSIILFTRNNLRAILTKKQFKRVRSTMYFFVGFFTYGLFPLSYLHLKHQTLGNSPSETSSTKDFFEQMSCMLHMPPCN